MQVMTISIDVSGKVDIDVTGVKGKSCQSLTEDMINSLGGNASTNYKTDYAMPEQTNKGIMQKAW